MKAQPFLIDKAKTWWTLALLASIAGCASNTFRLESTPEGAEVHWLRPGQTSRLLGKTPLSIDERVNAELFSETAHLEITLPNYLPETIVIPHTVVPMTARYTLNLKTAQLPEACLRQNEAASHLAKGIAEAQSLTIRKDYAQAESVLRQLSETFPQVAVVYDLLGNLYYMRHDVKKALGFYRQSNELLPNNPQTLRMIEKLSVIRGEGEGKSGGTRND